jgi:4-hydroxy-4-methyl-2-oxoglutarate aldolase
MSQRFQRVCGMFLDHYSLATPARISGELSDEALVNPGDFIFGDLDGALVIPKEKTIEALEEFERIIGIEDIARGEFARGDNPVEVFERHKRL